MDSTPLIGTNQVAQLLGVSPQRVLQLLADRADFPAPASQSTTARGIGSRRWRVADVESWNATANRNHGRRGSMKRLAMLVALGALVVPASACALSRFHSTPCRSTQPGFVKALSQARTTCAVARRVEHYWINHEMRNHQVLFMGGVRWRYRHVSSVEAVFVGPRTFQSVDIVHRPSG